MKFISTSTPIKTAYIGVEYSINNDSLNSCITATKINHVVKNAKANI